MRNRHDYPDDFFAETRMSFGDHIEELRTRLFKAIKALIFCLLIGFVLDTIGTQLDMPWLGVGKPMLAFIKKPVEDQIRDFYNERAWKEFDRAHPLPEDSPDIKELRKERDKEKEKFMIDRAKRAREDNTLAINEPQPLVISIPAKALDEKAATDSLGNISFTVYIRPIDAAIMLSEGNNRIGKRQTLTTLSAQEGFLVYFKVSMICGFVIASPIIFWQFWAFIAAGMYPHEKHYVNKYLPFSLILFFAGILLCQFWVLPGTVKALLAFNDWLDLDPDLRLNEWLGLALILPLVFGLSFQTPLVMLALNQIGILSPEAYMSKWKHATMIIAFFSAIVTPTPDIVTMLYLFTPMMGLYFLGIYLCKLFPQRSWLTPEGTEEETISNVAV